MTVEEASLYANLHVETSPVQTTASWTDHIATVRDISLSRGGYEPFAGINQVQPGSGTITLVDNTATILPGYWVKVRYNSTIIWGGYIQDVQQNYTNVNGVFYELKTLTVLDWAAWIAQFPISNLEKENTWYLRNRDIDALVPGTPVAPASGSGIFGGTDYLLNNRTGAEVLDITYNSMANGWWRSEATAPTGTSYLNLIQTGYTTTANDVALTDGSHTGTPTNLTYYTDIEVATRTSQVVNSVRVNNFHAVDTGFGITEELTTTYEKSDSSSIATYGSRFAECDANIGLTTQGINLVANPSYEDTDYELTSTNFYSSIEQPTLDAGGAWDAYDGLNAFRAYNLAGSGTNTSQGLDDRINVVAGTTYYAMAYAATTGSGSIRARTRIDWYNEANTLLSTSFGSFVSLSSFKTWYKTSTSATAPANAKYARLTVYFDRGGTLTFVTGTKLWMDGLYFGSSNEASWWDGDTTDTATNIYGWTGTPNASPSFRAPNLVDTLATQFLADNATAKYSPYTIRVNAQANLTAVQLFDLYESIYVWFDSHRWTSVVTGIQHNISINADNTTRWMIDLIVRPSTYTI